MNRQRPLPPDSDGFEEVVDDGDFVEEVYEGGRRYVFGADGQAVLVETGDDADEFYDEVDDGDEDGLQDGYPVAQPQAYPVGGRAQVQQQPPGPHVIGTAYPQEYARTAGGRQQSRVPLQVTQQRAGGNSVRYTPYDAAVGRSSSSRSSVGSANHVHTSIEGQSGPTSLSFSVVRPGAAQDQGFFPQNAAAPPPQAPRSRSSKRKAGGLGGGARRPCNCTKSQCLKLYCDCFANGEMCDGCNCRDCRNNVTFADERTRAIRTSLERNPNAFKPKIGVAQRGDSSGTVNDVERLHQKGCHCKKSNCLKNYCECYEAKVACTERCKCLSCRNTDLGKGTGGTPSSGSLPVGVRSQAANHLHLHGQQHGRASGSATPASIKREPLADTTESSSTSRDATDVAGMSRPPSHQQFLDAANGELLISKRRDSSPYSDEVENADGQLENGDGRGFNAEDGQDAHPEDPRATPWHYLTNEVVEASANCMLSQVAEMENFASIDSLLPGGNTGNGNAATCGSEETERAVLREFARCIEEVVEQTHIVEGGGAVDGDGERLIKADVMLSEAAAIYAVPAVKRG